jgi:hypothetical protein
MKRTTLMFALAATVSLPAVGFAQGSSANSPGQQMQEKGSKPGSPGASGYAPGQQMQDQGSKPGSPGASGYAPGQQDKGTTGSGASSSGSTSTDATKSKKDGMK